MLRRLGLIPTCVLIALVASGCTPRSSNQTYRPKFVRLTFDMPITPEESQNFRIRMMGFASKHSRGVEHVIIDAAEPSSNHYAMNLVTLCRAKDLIVDDIAIVAAPPDSVRRYRDMILKTAKCTPLAQPPPVVCDDLDSFSKAPLVRDETTARGIFLALEKSVNQGANRRRFPDLLALDYGNEWSVFRWREPRRWMWWREEPIDGGGQLAARIAKCDGKISRVRFSE